MSDGPPDAMNSRRRTPSRPRSPFARQAPDRNLALELVRVTEAAAMAAGRWVGRGDKNGGDGAAVDAMRALIGTVSMRGMVVIGEGEKDEAPMLYNGEEVGDGTGPLCDVAVDPVDGTTLMAKGMPNAVAVIAVSERGSMFDPSAVFYMDKIATGAGLRGRRSTSPPRRGEHRAGWPRPSGGHPEDVTVCILDRPAARRLVQEVREAGARIRFISDGDVAGAISAARPGTGVDLLLGIGGTPEGIIAAAALRCMGGVMQARLWPQDDAERQKAIDAGHDLDRVLTTEDLVRGDDIFFCATGSHRRRPAARRALLRRLGADRVDRHALEVGDDPAHRLPAPARQAAGILRRGLRPQPRERPDMMVVTTNDIPGWEIQRVCGEVFGLTVRSRNAFSQIGAGLKSMFGGELQGMTRNLSDSRNEVMGRMLEHARQKGGNAVIGMRFDTSEMGDVWTELCAYGTAVVAVPVTDAAKQTAQAMGYGGGGPAVAADAGPQAAGYPQQQPQYGQPAPQGYQQPQPPQYGQQPPPAYPSQ